MNKKRNDSIPEDYINVIYGEDVKPFTSYPSILTFGPVIFVSWITDLNK